MAVGPRDLPPRPAPSLELPARQPAAGGPAAPATTEGELLHHKYEIPSRCFAYVGAADQTSTWKLPYLLADGPPDLKRLPKAIAAILSNYRGTKVSIPRNDVADVLVRLGTAADDIKKVPCQVPSTAEVYSEAHEALDQLGRLFDVGCCAVRNHD